MNTGCYEVVSRQVGAPLKPTGGGGNVKLEARRISNLRPVSSAGGTEREEPEEPRAAAGSESHVRSERNSRRESKTTRRQLLREAEELLLLCLFIFRGTEAIGGRSKEGAPTAS